MAIETYKLGPGTLTLGAGPLQVAGQITNARVDWSESVSGGRDPIPVLSGEELAGEDGNPSYNAVLAGTLLQDLAAAGVIAWSWTNKGTEQAFTFVPNTVEARQVQGILVPVPLTIGGDVKVENTSDFSWRIIGDPDFEPVP